MAATTPPARDEKYAKDARIVCDDMVTRIFDFADASFASTTDELSLLQKLCTATASRYEAWTLEMTALGAFEQRLATKAKACEALFRSIDEIDQESMALESAADALDAYSRSLTDRIVRRKGPTVRSAAERAARNAAEPGAGAAADDPPPERTTAKS
jgi:Ser/Thr protein kinase RdoA (MazF antagonist)